MLKLIDGRAPPGVDPAGINLTQRWETYQVLYRKKKKDLGCFLLGSRSVVMINRDSWKN